MAKRKRLNRNVVIVLVTAGGLLLLLGAAAAWGLRHRIFRKDPAVCERLAKAAWERGEWDAADKAFGDAIRSIYVSGRADPQTAPYYYDYARFLLEWIRNKAPDMTETQRRERFAKAMSCLRTALLRDPKHVEAQRMLADISWDMAQGSGRWVLYINEADRLLSLTPEDHRTFFKRARAWEQIAKDVPGQNVENAVRDFKKATELKPDEPSYWATYASFLQQEGRPDEADKAYGDAIAALPDNPDLRVEYAGFLRAHNRPEEAIEQIQEAVKRAPNSPVGHLALAQMRIQEGKSDLALQALDAAKKIDENDYRVHVLLSQVHIMRKQPQKAIGTLRDGLAAITKRIEDTSASAPSTEQTRRLEDNKRLLAYYLADSLLDQIAADPNVREQYLAEAKKLVEPAAATPADHARRSKVAGRVAFMEGDMPSAERMLEEAYQGLGLADVQGANYLIQVYLRQNLPGKAEKILDRIRRNPTYANDARMLLLKAQLEMQYRNLEQANKYVDQVLKSDPNNSDALGIRRIILAAQGRMSPEQVLTDLDVSRADIAAMVNRGMTLWVEEEKDTAVKYMEVLYAKVPDNERVLQALLWMYSVRDEQAKAIQLIERAKSAFPVKAAMLELQEKLIQEKDPNKKLEIALLAADATTDPFQKAIEKANIAAMFRNDAVYVSCVQEAARINPNDPVVVERLFRIALADKDWKQAEECINRAVQNNTDGAEGRLYRAQLAISQQQYAQAIPLLVETLQLRPNAKLPGIMLGDCYLRTNDIAKAREVYEIVAGNDPAYATAAIRMAMITEQQGKMAEHAEWISRAHRLAPTDPYVQAKYLEMLEDRGDPAEVIVHRERLLRRDPNDLANRLRLAGLYERAKRNDQAEEIYLSVYNRGPTTLTATGLLAGFYARTNRLADADRLLVNLLQTAPDKVGAYLLYGEFLSRHSLEQARVAVEKAIAADPNDPRGHLTLARLSASTKDFEGAIRGMGKYLELRPDDQAARRQLIRYSADAGQTAQARQQLEVMLAANPSDAETLTIMGMISLRQGQTSEGVGFLDRAIQANPNYAEPLAVRAMGYIVQGRDTEAKLDLENARRLSDSPSIATDLAGVHVRMGDLSGAQAILRDLLDKPEAADYAPAMSMLAELYLQQQTWPLLAPLLERAEQKYPNNLRYRQMEARMYQVTGDRAKALAALEKATADTGGSPGLLRDYLLALMEAGRYARVLSVSQPYADRSGYESWIAAIRAEALARSGDVAKADETFLSASRTANADQLSFVVERMVQAYGANRTIEKLSGWLNSRPKEPTLYRMLGTLYRDRQEYAKASEMFLKAVELSADDESKGTARRDLALTYYMLGKYPQAEEAFLEALKALPNDTMVMNNLAYMYANELGQPDKALPYAEKAATMMSQSPDLLDTYGWTLAKLAQYGEAEKNLLRAIQLSETPGQAVAPRYHLGFVYEQTGRLAEAARQYRQGSEALSGQTTNPLYKDFSEAIKRVQQKQAVESATTRSAA